MSVDAGDFKQGMRRLGASVCIITTKRPDGARNGLHVATGMFGIGMGAAGEPQAASYFRIVGIVYSVLTVAGLLLVRTGELMGMAHNQADLLLQAGIAAFALVLGFAPASRSPRRAW